MPSKKSCPRHCAICGQRFFVRPVDAKRGKGIVCGRTCSGKLRAHQGLVPRLSGERNGNWKGGKTRNSQGYILVLRPDHPRAQRSGYVSRALIVLEKKLRRSLLPDEVAHHINEIKDDDRPENLEVMKRGDHTRHHHGPQWRRARLLKQRQRPRNPAHPSNRRYQWPSDRALLELSRALSLRKIALLIGCSHKVVDRRIKRVTVRINSGKSGA